MTEDTRFDWIQDELKQHRMAFFSQDKVRSKFQLLYAGATSTAQRREIASRVACARGGKFVQGPVMSELPAGFPGLFWWVTHVEIMLSQQGNIQIVFTAIADGSTIHVIWNSTFGSSLASHYGPIEGSTTKEGVNHVMRCNVDFDLFVRHAFAFENLDRIAKSFEDMEADIKCDIMDWDYHVYEPGSFDVMWASPPCTEYSRAKTCGVRNIEMANAIVQRTIDIIEYFNPSFYIMENPQTGLL